MIIGFNISGKKKKVLQEESAKEYRLNLILQIIKYNWPILNS